MRRIPWLTFSGRGGSRCMEQISATRKGKAYARGTYLYDYFLVRPEQGVAAEARFFAFRLRERVQPGPPRGARRKGPVHVSLLNGYRDRFLGLVDSIDAEIIPVPGAGL